MSFLLKALQDRYADVTNCYPVLLLHDEIWLANCPEAMKNMFDQEFRVFDIASPSY